MLSNKVNEAYAIGRTNEFWIAETYYDILNYFIYSDFPFANLHYDIDSIYSHFYSIKS
jgi:hypothetical protein